MVVWPWGAGRRAQGFELGGVGLGACPWLVLGGGGLRGLAHLGVLRVLAEVGFRPVGVLGTSIGALVGACYAGGQSIDEMDETGRRVTRDDIARMSRRLLWLKGIRSQSLYRGDVLRDYLTDVLPDRGWESLSLRFQANAVELGTGRTEWFGIGARTDVSLVDAIYASTALPVFYPPAPLPGGLYVDGGAEDSLPIQRAAELGATGIVAVDVGSSETADAQRVVDLGMLAIHERIFSVMSGRRRRQALKEWDGPPLLVIRPDVQRFGTLDFKHLDATIEAGAQAARALVGEVTAGVGPSP